MFTTFKEQLDEVKVQRTFKKKIGEKNFILKSLNIYHQIKMNLNMKQQIIGTFQIFKFLLF